MLTSWHETTTNWQYRAQSPRPDPWQALGAKGANDRAAAFQTFIPSSQGTFELTLNAAGRAMVQDWVEGEPNHGLIIAHNTNNNPAAVSSRNEPLVTRRPMMTVTYTAAD
jgi:hypothetical protein